MPAAKRRLLETRADADDMADDYALLRKVKKGKITEVRPSGSKNSLNLPSIWRHAWHKAFVRTCHVHVQAGLHAVWLLLGLSVLQSASS